MRIQIGVTAYLQGLLDSEPAAARRAVADAVREAGQAVRTEVKAHTKAAGLGRLGNAWRAKFFRNRGLDAASVVFPLGKSARAALAAYETGAIVRPRGGGRYLAIPTGFNRKGGRRAGPPLVTPEQMTRAGRAMTFALDAGGRVKLWCIRVLRAQRRVGSARRIRDIATAGGFHVVGSGRVRRTKEILERGFVPLFVLVPQVTIRKRLDVRGLARRWEKRLAELVAEHWEREKA